MPIYPKSNKIVFISDYLPPHYKNTPFNVYALNEDQIKLVVAYIESLIEPSKKIDKK